MELQVICYEQSFFGIEMVTILAGFKITPSRYDLAAG